MAIPSAPEAKVVNYKGYSTIPAGTNTPVFDTDVHGNGYFAGSLRVDGEIQTTGGGTFGYTMGNNEFLAGLTTANVVKRLIGVNASNVVSIDADAVGVVFGGAVTITSGTITAGTITATTAFVGGTVSATVGTFSSTLQGTVVTATTAFRGDGTAAAPAHSFVSAPANGLYHISSTAFGVALSASKYYQFATGGLTFNNISGTGATLVEAAANTLQLVNGTATQEFRVGPTSADMRLSKANSGSGSILNVDNQLLAFGVNNVVSWYIAPTTYTFTPNVDNTYSIGDATHRASNIFGVVFSAGTTTSIATAGTIRTAHNNQWLGRDSAGSNNRNVIAWGVTTTDTVIVGDPNVSLSFNASGTRINGVSGFSGTIFAASVATVTMGIITAVA